MGGLRPEDDFADLKAEEKKKKVTSEEEEYQKQIKRLEQLGSQVKKETPPVSTGRVGSPSMLSLATPSGIKEETATSEPQAPAPVVDEKKETKTGKTTKETPEEFPRIILGDSEEADFLEKQLQKNLEAYARVQDPEVTGEDRRKELFDDLKKVQEDRDAALAWGQIAERFLAAATKYASAKQGLARGLDMSNAQIERTNWDKLMDRAYTKYKDDYSELVKRFDAQDKAKALTDKQKADMLKEKVDLLARIKGLKDRRRARQASLDQEHQRRMQRAKEKQQEMTIREARRTGDADTFASLFTDDPATANELKVAAMQGEKQFEKTLNQASVRDKLKADALKPHMKRGWFGFGEEKLDPESMRKTIRSAPEKTVDTLSAEDQAALKWAYENADDPRAEAIRAKLREKTGL